MTLVNETSSFGNSLEIQKCFFGGTTCSKFTCINTRKEAQLTCIISGELNWRRKSGFCIISLNWGFESSMVRSCGFRFISCNQEKTLNTCSSQWQQPLSIGSLGVTWFMYCGFESKLCIIWDMAGFCNIWLNWEASGVAPRGESAPSIPSPPSPPRPPRPPKPPRPPSPGLLVSPPEFVLPGAFVWPVKCPHNMFNNVYIITSKI